MKTCVVMPTVPREPKTLTHAVKTVLVGLEGAGDTKLFLVKNSSVHPEADLVAEEFGLTLWDGTARHPEADGDISWERKLTLDMARALEWAADTHAEHILYLEDDVEAAPYLWKTLYSRSWLTILFSGLCGINNWYHPNPCGTVALLFRNDETLAGLIRALRQWSQDGPADMLLARYLQNNNLTQCQRIPNPIQHKGLYSSRNGDRFELTSPTYREGSSLHPPLATIWAGRYFATRLKIWLERKARV